MTMKECYKMMLAQYPNTPVQVEYAMAEFRPEPCGVYAENIGHFYGKTWDAAWDAMKNRNNPVQAPPDEEYDCPVHGKLGGIDECPRC